MRFFKLTEVQANAILDTRLRSLRRLEEMELKREQKELKEEKASIESLLGSEKAQWKTIAWEIREVRKAFGPETRARQAPHDLRRGARHLRDRLRRGDGRARADHGDRVGKGLDPRHEGSGRRPLRRAVQGRRQAEDRLLRGDDLEDRRRRDERALLHPRRREAPRRARLRRPDPPHGRSRRGRRLHRRLPLPAGSKLLVVSSDGRGFVAPADDTVANTRKGKQVLTLDAPASAVVCAEAEGDHVAIIGENRKLLVFPIMQVPEMGRGKGVRLQRYKDGGGLRRQGLRAQGGPDLEGHAPAAPGPWPRRTCATGSATAPKPAACRRRVFRSRTGLGEGRAFHAPWPGLVRPIHILGTAAR